MPKVLRRLKIDEVSAVDAGAGDGCRVLLRKRNDSEQLLTKLRKIFGCDRRVAGFEERAQRDFDRLHPIAQWLVQKAKANGDVLDVAGVLCWLDDRREQILGKSDDSDARAEAMDREQHERDVDDDDDTGGTDHHAKVKDLLAAHDGMSPKARQRFRQKLEHLAAEAAVLDGLSERSTALLHHLRMNKGVTIMPDNWETICKDAGGVIELCKTFVENKTSYSMDEATLTKLVTQEAQRRYPDKTPAGAFAEFYSKRGAESAVLQKAYAILKSSPHAVEPIVATGDADMRVAKGVYDHASLQPSYVGGEAIDPNNPRKALDQLNALVEKQREKFPFLSTEQLFAQVYRANPELAKREREEAYAALPR